MDDYGLELSGLDPDSIAELRRLRKEQRMAEAMMQQGEQPLRGQMVGGVYVRPSIFQGLAGMANTYAGNKRSQAVDEGYRSLSEKRKAVEAAAFDKFQQGFYGSPEKTEQLPEGMFGPPQTTPAVVPDMNSKQQAIIELLRSQSPTAKMVAPMMNQELNRQREQQEFRDALKGAAGGGQLTGFEPMQNGVPGQQGMVGDPQNLIQDIAMNPDMSNEDKQAAIAQIRQQSAGAGGGQIDPTKLILSGNKMAMTAGKALQDKSTADKPYFTYASTPQGIVKLDARGKADPAFVSVGSSVVQKSEQDPTHQGAIAGAKEAGKGAGEYNMDQYKTAESAADNIARIDALITHIDKSDAITGLGADVFKNIERAKALLGNKAAQGKVTDTELLDIMMGSEVFPMIKSLGIGAKGMDTPAEREFMRKVLTGEISLNKDTIRQMAQIRKDIAARAVDKFNARVDSGELDQFFSTSGLQRKKFDYGMGQAQSGQGGKTVVREVKLKDGRIGVEYSDGSRGYK